MVRPWEEAESYCLPPMRLEQAAGFVASRKNEC